MTNQALLEVNDLKQYFQAGRDYVVKAVDGVSFHIKAGETYGLVGESGSGKSTIGRSLIRLYDPTEGQILFDGMDISGQLTTEEAKNLRLNMQMIFQDPMASLNPRKKVIDIVTQGLEINGIGGSNAERVELGLQAMERVGLSRDYADRYPQQFSGGQCQRIGIARALIMQPKLIIADESISALDVSIQAQIVNLLKEIQADLGLSYLFITHDLSMVKYISDRIGVLHYGHMLETGTTDEIFNNPIHPYTKSLISAIPSPNPILERTRQVYSYDKEALGFDYEAAEEVKLSENHSVWLTPDKQAELLG